MDLPHGKAGIFLVLTSLAKARAIPQRQLDDEIQARLANEAAVVSAQAAVEQAQINLGFTKVTSLVDDIAGSAQLQVGSFVSQTLIVLLDPNEIVADMHKAYRRVRLEETAYGCFIAGPSATTDIEATLVHGAQGVHSLDVFFLPRASISTNIYRKGDI